MLRVARDEMTRARTLGRVLKSPQWTHSSHPGRVSTQSYKLSPTQGPSSDILFRSQFYV